MRSCAAIPLEVLGKSRAEGFIFFIFLMYQGFRRECYTSCMLTTSDLKQISDLMDVKFDSFAIIMKNALDTKPDREEIEERFDAIDARFDRLEHKVDALSFTVNQNHDRRLEVLEDTVRQIRTKLQM